MRIIRWAADWASIVLVLVLVVVLDLSRFWQPGLDYEDENDDEDD